MRPGLLAAITVSLLFTACTRPAQVTLYEERHGRKASPADADSSGMVHTVVRDESVYLISQRYGVATRAIIDANGLRPPYRLHVGQKLKLPRPLVHQVASGDTVYGISRRYGLAMNQIVELNGLRPPYRIASGQRLRLPGAVETREASRVAVAAAKVASAGKVERRELAPPQSTGTERPGITSVPLPAPGEAPAAAPAPASPPVQEARRTPAPDPAPELPSVSPQGFVWPVEGKLLSGFGSKGRGLHNDGINLVAPRGTPVRAAQSGVVAYAGNELRGFGNLVLIKHSGGVMTAYAHNETLLVRQGQAVTRGEPIAKVGSSGSVDIPQLHFEIRFGRQAVDPMKFLGTRTAGAGVRSAAFQGARRGPE